ncbi:hypothetical protein BDN70DRAFT_938565 [Pholiota conissans]|uniref:Uncharacterized protein n=1 Tax=Pholiota conissans TaxID=109636 RepID=A0A9P6CMM4_9AGAR|nr:hypothetical protein BDN70DRAFT_938565 [Pholiota conissans]
MRLTANNIRLADALPPDYPSTCSYRGSRTPPKRIESANESVVVAATQGTADGSWRDKAPTPATWLPVPVASRISKLLCDCLEGLGEFDGGGALPSAANAICGAPPSCNAAGWPFHSSPSPRRSPLHPPPHPPPRRYMDQTPPLDPSHEHCSSSPCSVLLPSRAYHTIPHPLPLLMSPPEPEPPYPPRAPGPYSSSSSSRKTGCGADAALRVAAASSRSKRRGDDDRFRW